MDAKGRGEGEEEENDRDERELDGVVNDAELVEVINEEEAATGGGVNIAESAKPI